MMPASNAGVGMNMGFPDVCLTPAAPSPIPVPYPNMGMNSQELPPAGGGRILISGCPGHNMGGKPVTTTGMEAGSANPLFKMPGGCMVGNPKILMGGMPAEHLATPSFGNNYNDGLGAKLVPSVTNVLLTGLASSLADAHGLPRWSRADLELVAAELSGAPTATLGLAVFPTRAGLEVAQVRAGGLGADLGLRRGDRLTHLDGAPLAADDALPALRAGQPLAVTFRRAGEVRTRWGRARAVAAVSGTLDAAGVGQLALRRCSLTAPAEVRALLEAWQGAGARAVVLDLRGNPGGCLRSAAAVAGAFLGARRPFARVRDDRGERALDTGPTAAAWSGPLRVRLDASTASAAEALAAALQDQGRASLTGATSFGKGIGERLRLVNGVATTTGARLRVARADGRPLDRVRPAGGGR